MSDEAFNVCDFGGKGKQIPMAFMMAMDVGWELKLTEAVDRS